MNHQLIYAGPWTGGVTDRTAIIKASVINGVQNAGVEISIDPNFKSTTFVPCTSIWQDQTGKFKRKLLTISLSDLQPHQQYHYRLVLNDTVQENSGAFRTFPPARQRHDFRIVFASCSGNKRFTNLHYPMPEAFVAIRKEPDISLFLHLGDLHYANIRKPELASRLEKYDWMLQRKEPGELFRSHAIAYIWDDHDFL
ncbi:MAG TPA: hypothetical protein VLH08_21980, partial [Acidobacteriota bacterium]|nr:hypothetical protein [Acidobacteriota bacterium]